MLIDVEAPLPGLIRASSHRQDDVMYLLARRFRQQAAFCLDTKANVVEQHWREIVRALERDENGTDKLQKDLFGHIKEYCTHSVICLVCRSSRS